MALSEVSSSCGTAAAGQLLEITFDDGAVHRLRRRYRELLREAIAGTVADPSEVDDEIRHLMEALAG